MCKPHRNYSFIVYLLNCACWRLLEGSSFRRRKRHQNSNSLPAHSYSAMLRSVLCAVEVLFFLPPLILAVSLPLHGKMGMVALFQWKFGMFACFPECSVFLDLGRAL